MNKKHSPSLVLGFLALLSATTVVADSSYFNAVTNLNPAGYWPMHEVEAAAPGNIETNYGSLGALGNGYYNDWVTLPSATASIIRQVPGPLVATPDTGAYFTNTAGRQSNAGWLMVPNIAQSLQLKPPFTVEGWAEASVHQVGTFSSMVGQGGGAGLNNSPSFSGWSLNWNNPAGNSGAIYNMYAWGGPASGTIANCANAATTVVTSNVWYYFAYEFTTNNTSICVANGAVNINGSQLNPPLPATTWSPFFVGNARNNATGPAGFSFDGALAEVAIYTNQLDTAELNYHYNAGTNASPGTNYFQVVTNDNPIIYLRMNAPAYSTPDISTWPALTNYGTVAANGVYTPGTLPGSLTGSPVSGFPAHVGSHVPLLSAMGTYADAGGDSSYNPSGSSAAFSVSALFRGNPTDPRTQSIVGHGTNSWMLGLTVNGLVVFNAGTNGGTAEATGTAAGDLVGTATNNDGFWHYVVATCNQGTNVLYVDGAPVATNVTTASIAGNASDVMIGADPSYTNANDNLGRQFSGQICEVAFFTYALSNSQVQTLYNALAVVPYVRQQPVSTSVSAGSSFTNPAVAGGSAPLAYQWFTNGVARGGQTNASYILNPVAPSDACTNIYMVVTNSYGAATSAVVSLTVFTSPAFSSQSPVTYTNMMTLFAGASPTFSVSASGALPIYYYWYSNNVAIAGATNTSYTLTNVQAGATLLTNFYCVASNFIPPTATSFVWSASIIPAPTGPYASNVLALNPISFWRLNEPDDTLADGNMGAISHDFWSGNDGIYTNTGLGGFDALDDVVQPGYYDTLDTNTVADFGTTVYANSDAYGVAGIDFSSPTNTSKAFTVEAWVNGYVQTTNGAIIAKGYGGGGEQFCIDTGAGGSSFDFRFFVRDSSGASHNANSSIAPSLGVWHHLVGVCDEPNGLLTLYIDGQSAATATIPTTAGILASTSPMTIGSRASSQALWMINSNDLQFSGFVSDVAVYNNALTAAQVQSHYYSAGIPPFITQLPPVSTNISEGQTLTVPVTVIGTPPLGYQWYDLNNSSLPIGGQTNATLVISNITPSFNNHNVYLTINNLYGTTNTSSVQIGVISGPPQLIASNLPPNLTLAVGQSYTYSVTAVGSPPITYQWFNGATLLAGQTNTTYTVTNAALGTYTYSVVMSNSYAPVTASSMLTVIPLPTDAYSTNVLNLKAVGYWPLQETNLPAPANLETNYGTLGALGNAYYASTNATGVTFGNAGLPGGNSDTAAGFSGINGVTPTSYAFVPRVSPALTLQPPLTLECWVFTSSTAFGDLMGEGGSGYNATAGNGNAGGVRLSYGGAAGGGNLQLYVMDGNGTDRPSIGTPGQSISLGAWHHCVATLSGPAGSLNANLYIDGVLEAGGGFTEALDTWTPLTIGAGYYQGYSPIRGFSGIEDEVAIYTNVLTTNQIMAHFAAGTNSSANYFMTVTNDKPLLYYRMDNPSYVSPTPALNPTAINYGSSAVNGAYLQEIVPGGLLGPATNLVAALMNGVFSGVDAGYNAAFNPTGTQPFSATTWFKSYPADGRLQTLIGHGRNWSLNLDGTTGDVVWTNSAGPVVASAGAYNDGNWHFAAGVYDGSHNYLYMDGQLTSSASAPSSLASDTADDLYLGGNAAFTQIGYNQVFFAGALAQASYYTNALSAGQIQSLYHIIVPGAPTLGMTNLVISYTGTLQYSTNVAGPYSTVAGAASPYAVPVTNSQMFYRASQ